MRIHFINEKMWKWKMKKQQPLKKEFNYFMYKAYYLTKKRFFEKLTMHLVDFQNAI